VEAAAEELRRLEYRRGVVMAGLVAPALGVLRGLAAIRRPVVTAGPWFRFRGCDRFAVCLRGVGVAVPACGSLTMTQFLPSSSAALICLRFAAGAVGVDARLSYPVYVSSAASL